MDKDEVKLLSTSEASKMLGVSVYLIRKWDKQGILKPDFKTGKGESFYKIETLRSFNPLVKQEPKK